jgi:hypothetical protein
MDPENTTTDTAAPAAATTEQPATQPAGQTANQGATFSAEQQEAVNRIVAKRLEEDRARRAAAAATPAPKPAPAGKPAEQPDLAAEIAEMRRSQTELKQQLDYERRTKSLGLDEAKAAALFSVYQANPDGFDNVVSALGIKANQPAATAAPTATTEQPRPPAAAPSAPSGANLPMQGGVIDIFAMTPAQLRQQGPEFVRTQLESLWKIGNQLSGAPRRPVAPSQRK